MTARHLPVPTLRGRVSRLALGVIAAWVVLLAAGFDLLLLNRLDGQVNDSLRVRAQAASATVDTRGGRIVGVRESATDSALDSSIWVYSGARAIERPRATAELRAAADELSRGERGYSDRAGHRFYVLPVTVDGDRAGAVMASLDLGPTEHTQNLVLFGSVAVTLLLLAGAYPVLRLAARRALEPVDRMTRQAADWSVTAPGERFGTGQRYEELRSFAATLDELLDRLAAVVRHERHLSAELSPELRTPLARITAQVDLALAGAAADQRDDLLAIRANCVQLDGIIDALLAAARSDLTSTVGRCELQPLFERLAADEPALVCEPTTLAVGVETEIVSRALAPVLVNARRYASTEVRLSAARVPGGVAIDVVNDGPLLAGDLAERVFEPGFRIDPDDGHDGAGLGLALARRLARSADGDLVVAEASRTTFRLTLPAG